MGLLEFLDFNETFPECIDGCGAPAVCKANSPKHVNDPGASVTGSVSATLLSAKEAVALDKTSVKGVLAVTRQAVVSLGYRQSKMCDISLLLMVLCH